MQHSYTLFTGATVYRKGKLEKSDIAFSEGKIVLHSTFPSFPQTSGLRVSIRKAEGKLILPGLADVHVHLREPGFSYKETIRTGTLAAARGGYTDICAMPNVNPVPDSSHHMRLQQKIISQDACVRVHPYASITRSQEGKELIDFAALAPFAIAFSDDGRGIQNEGTMREAMLRVKAISGLLAAHCEDNSLLRGGVIHDGAYAKAHNHPGISSESEWAQLKRDIRLAGETGCRYHACHISTKESVGLVRQAKQENIDITCETAPHYLLFNDSRLQEDGRFKMNPPIREKADQEALIEGLADGTIDIIATDHAPHAEEEKDRGLRDSAMGVVGLECAFAALYTGLVKTGLIPLERLLYAMIDAPRKRFGLPPVSLEAGDAADMAVFDVEKEFIIDPRQFVSKGRATPFAGWQALGQCDWTIVGGETVWQQNGAQC